MSERAVIDGCFDDVANIDWLLVEIESHWRSCPT